MPAKKSRSNPKGDENNYELESFASYNERGEPSEVIAGGMIRSNVLKTFGNEVKASISRMNPDGYSNETIRSETSDYFHINNSATPFHTDKCGIGAYESIELCQKAFYGFPAFRNPILMQSYLSNSPLHWTGKNKKVVKFYQEWAKKCNLWSLANEWFLEWFRSGNVFVYSFTGELKLSEVKKVSLAKGFEAVARNRKLPLKYILLNPCDVRGIGTAIFADQSYGKVLNAYEISVLENPQTDHDKAVFEGLDPEVKKAIKAKSSPVITLDPAKLRIAFSAKQSYEPMAVPPYFGVLRSINFKQILRSAEEKVAASADFCILLVKAGSKDIAKTTENNKLVQAVTNLFSAQSVGRVLVSHWSTEMEFHIPELNKIFGNEKYINVDKDIINGMNDIMASDENFATGQTKTKIYLQLLSQARESFLNYFLIPEIDKIAAEMGFAEADIPQVQFEEVSLESLNEAKKLYNRLYELGVLTPEELFNAYETNQIPLFESAVEKQKEFKAQKKAGLFEPLIGNKAEAGRPTGTGTPKTKNTVAPKGGKASLEKLQEIYPAMSSLTEAVQKAYKEKNSLARLGKNHKQFCEAIWEKIVVAESPDKWRESVASYVESPFKGETEQKAEIEELSDEHQIGLLEAALIYHAQK
jgi:hypothetical protein